MSQPCVVCRQVACVCPPKADWDKACHFCGQMKCGCSQQDRQGTGAGPYRQPAVVHCGKEVRNRAGVLEGLCARQPGHKLPCGIGMADALLPIPPRTPGDLAILHLGALRRLRAAERALDAAENERNAAQAAVKSAEAALRAAVEQE